MGVFRVVELGAIKSSLIHRWLSGLSSWKNCTDLLAEGELTEPWEQWLGMQSDTNFPGKALSCLQDRTHCHVAMLPLGLRSQGYFTSGRPSSLGAELGKPFNPWGPFNCPENLSAEIKPLEQDIFSCSSAAPKIRWSFLCDGFNVWFVMFAGASGEALLEASA